MKSTAIKNNNSDKLIEAIRSSSSNMSYEEYVKATGLDGEYIFNILKGHIEEVDDETMKKLTLRH